MCIHVNANPAVYLSVLYLFHIFAVCDLPDTFNSWFLVTELHVWLLAARMMADGEEGRYTRNSMMEAMWQDAEERSKKLGVG